MKHHEVLAEFRVAGALLEGHFVLSSGLHSPNYVQCAQLLQHRAMVLVYLSLDTDQFTEFDAHYFPETPVRISRLSEPKNYSLTVAPAAESFAAAASITAVISG